MSAMQTLGSHLGRARFRLAFLLLFLLLSALSGLFLLQVEQHAELATRLYHHPFTVSNAVLRLDVLVTQMHHLVTEAVLLPGERTPAQTRIALARMEEEALGEFALIGERFLGNPVWVRNARQAFSDWRPLRENILTELEADRMEQARRLLLAEETPLVARLETLNRPLLVFAQDKANAFQEESGQTALFTLPVALGLITSALVLGGFLSVGLYRRAMRTEEDHRRLFLAHQEKALFLDNILQTATDLSIVATDTDLVVRYFNPVAEKLFAHTAAEMIGQTIHDIHRWHQVDPERFQTGLEQVHLRGEHRYSVERTRQGHRQVVESRVSAILDDAGKIAGYLLLSRDVSEQKRADAEVRRSEKKYRTLLETANDAIILANADTGVLVEANPQAEVLLGRPLSEILGQPMTCLHPPEEAEHYARVFADHVRQGSSKTVEAEIMRKDGRRVAVEIRAGVSDMGEMRIIQGIFRDVSERKEAERRLGEERDKLFAILEAMHDGLYIVNGGCDLEYVNPVIERQFGPVDGRKCHLYFHDLEHRCPWCKNDQVRTGAAVRWEWRSPKTGKTYDLFDAPLHRSDGSVSKLEIFHDITDSKRMEEALRQSERFARATIDALQAYLCVLEEDGTIIAVNQAWSAFARRALPAELRLERGDDYLALCDSGRGVEGMRGPLLAAGIRAVLQGKKEQFSMEYPVLDQGEERWFLTRVTRFPDQNPPRVAVSHENITEIKLAERTMANLNALLEERVEQRTRELERSNQDLQQFAYVASHDLQEPLRQVSGFAQLLKRRYQGRLDEKADQFIDFTVEGCQRMLDLIHSLLAYSRVGTHAISPDWVEGEEILQLAISNLLTFIKETRAEISHDPLPRLWGDGQQLVQLMQNLLSNAIKFHQPDLPPRVHVSAQRETDHWLMQVEDNGLGIEPQYLERIFVIFQRLHARARFPGTGIGLAICKRIVERHHGDIRVTSQPGQGTCFLVSLPFPEAWNSPKPTDSSEKT